MGQHNLRPYHVLGVKPGATFQEIKGSYRRLALALHPDRTGGDPVKADRFREVVLAYKVLEKDSLKSVQKKDVPTAAKPPTKKTAVPRREENPFRVPPRQKPRPFGVKEPEYASLEDFVSFLMGDEKTQFTFRDLDKLSQALGKSNLYWRKQLEQYGFTLARRAPERQVWEELEDQ
jgi:hypothetical protein